ncbi:MAG: hypothetical protein EVA58_05320 [Kiritimatiellaceae bacterium]|nr:MAG: hypothetical protein EVA58_05320 [Kiritimatiellaceae bacterium]
MLNKTAISKRQRLSRNALFSYEIEDHNIVNKLFGIIPIHKLAISHLSYPRLAAPTELNPIKNLYEQTHLLQKRKSSRAYIIESTQQNHLFVIYLTGKTLFILRQAIGKAHDHSHLHRRFR